MTANVLPAAANDISLGVNQLFTARSWTVAGSLIAHLAPGSMVAGRTIDWSSGATRVMFQDRAALPLPVDNTWKVFTTFEFPIRGGGRIPVSVIYSNDPNGDGQGTLRERSRRRELRFFRAEAAVLARVVTCAAPTGGRVLQVR